MNDAGLSCPHCGRESDCEDTCPSRIPEAPAPLSEPVDSENFIPKEPEEIKKLTVACLYLVKKCRDLNAAKMTITQENVTEEGKSIGNWKIKVEKIS